jgi:2-amino-4-hydroxy-6-hydroxymethyldihydropteridine diphosphokinase
MALRGVSWAFLGLGSNIEDRLDYLQGAVDALARHDKIRVDTVSSVYETEPVGGPEQGPYLNMAVRAATLLSPRRLLAVAKDIEQALGRRREQRWGPRTIDIDILLYDTVSLSRRTLEIPHPRLTERPFALVPLLEVAPGMRLPDGRSLASVLASLAPIEGVTMVGSQVTAPGGALR